MGIVRSTAKHAILTALSARDRRKGDHGPLAPSLWDLTVTSGGVLGWDGVQLASLARQFGTPLYAVSRSRLRKNYDSFYQAFSSKYPHVEIGYSYKTNPLPAVIRTLHELGASAEVISHFELWLALRLGVTPDRIIFNGPAKPELALDLAVDKGVKLINVDSLGEIELIDRATSKYGRQQQVGVRVVTSVGWSSQFGLRISGGAAMEAFRCIKGKPRLIPCALHAHLGTGIRDCSVYFQAISEMLDFAKQLRAEFGIEIRFLDMGGGFGVPTVRPFSELDSKFLANGFPIRAPSTDGMPTTADYAEGIISRLERAYGSKPESLPQIIFEPGRAITSSAQCLLLSVLVLKEGDRFSQFAIVDGGKNITIPLGYEYHELFLANRLREPADTRYTIFGPLCHPGDILFRHRYLPALRVGDVVAIMDAGAYFVPNQMNFSNPRPAAVMIADGHAALIRTREAFEDIIRLDSL